MQPNKVMQDYLVELLGRPHCGKPSTERAVRPTHAVEPATSTPACGDEPQVDQSAVAEKLDKAELSAGKRAAARTGLERGPVDGATGSEIPAWATEPFQILIFRVHGVVLSVPLQKLDSISRWNGQSTSIPGQPDWQRGLYLLGNKRVSLVDLSRLIMPERDATATAVLPGYLLLVGGARWGLLCDTIQRPRLVRATDVRWRRRGKHRPWSHGIVVENLSVLLHVDALLTMLGTDCA
jgi:chemotaxis signal transduction protein